MRDDALDFVFKRRRHAREYAEKRRLEMLRVQQLIGFGVGALSPLFVAATTAGPTAGPTVTINVPSGVLDGDVLVLVAGRANRSTGSGWNVPSGWTGLVSFINDNLNPCTLVARRVASSEPASYNVTHASGSASNVSAMMLAYRFCTYEGISTMNTGTSTSPATNTLATAYGGVLSCSVFACNVSGSVDFTSTAPAVERANVLTAPSLAGQDAGGFSGTIPAQAGTLASSSYWRGWQLSLRP